MTTTTANDGNIAELREMTRVVLRPLGSPLPLGIISLVPASMLLSLQQIGAIPATQGKTMGWLMLGFVVPLELIASVLSFWARDSVAGTGLGIFGGSWLATGLTLLTSAPGTRSSAFGVFLLCIAIAFVVLIAGAAFGKSGPAVVIVAGAARFLLAGLYEVIGSTGLEHAAAIVGFVLAGAALYTALATELEDVNGGLTLPMGRRARARQALTGPVTDQLDALEHEAGIRQQL